MDFAFKPLHEWGLPPFEKLLVIAGPCSAESEGQVLATAQALKAQGIPLFRAGSWKPRTRPDSFEGFGKTALKWLRSAGNITGIKVCTEVANKEHVDAALNLGMDALWIGARTTANPFAMQEIADALKGVDIPVMIKNPVTPDLELWVGAVERIAKTGISRIAAVHRGFTSAENYRYRNKPLWEIPIELKRRMPGLPMICDPSHICGSRESLSAVSQNAIDLDFQGLMIETHIDPEHAFTDAKQQVSPEQLKALLEGLVIRRPTIDNSLTRTFLEEIRYTIDKIDEKMIEYLSQRMELAKVIGLHKRANNVTILQPERWEEIVQTRINAGVSKELNAEFVKKLFEIIHQEAIFQQDSVMNPEKEKLFTPTQPSV